MRGAARKGGPYRDSEEAGGEGGAGAEPGQGLGELRLGGAQAIGAEGSEPVQDEHRRRGRVADPGAQALAPVPAPAGHPAVVPPDHLAGLGVLDDRLPVGGGVEVLVTGGPDEPGRPGVAVQVLAADREQAGDGDGVVGVGDPVDARQARPHPAQQGLDAWPGPLRPGPEPTERLPPLGHLRQFLGARAVQVLAGPVLGTGQQRVAGLIARPGPQSLGDDQQRGVVRPQRPHLGGHRCRVKPHPCLFSCAASRRSLRRVSGHVFPSRDVPPRTGQRILLPHRGPGEALAGAAARPTPPAATAAGMTAPAASARIRVLEHGVRPCWHRPAVRFRPPVVAKDSGFPLPGPRFRGRAVTVTARAEMGLKRC